MSSWRRSAILILGAVAAALLALLIPLPPFYQPIAAVLFFVAFSRLLKVASFGATFLFALVLSSLPILMFSVVAAGAPQVHFYEAFYWSIISIAGLPGLVAFFLLPIAIALATYAGRRWLYP